MELTFGIYYLNIVFIIITDRIKLRADILYAIEGRNLILNEMKRSVDILHKENYMVYRYLGVIRRVRLHYITTRNPAKQQPGRKIPTYN